MALWSIFDCDTHQRVSERAYASVEEANHDYHMNQGHTYIGPVTQTLEGSAMLELLDWLQERKENCLRLAKSRDERDQGGWFEDAAYFQAAIYRIKALDGLIIQAQRALAAYIVPDSDITDAQIIGELFGILDGPEQREAQGHK